VITILTEELPIQRHLICILTSKINHFHNLSLHFIGCGTCPILGFLNSLNLGLDLLTFAIEVK
jgi:hypothetical protein